MIRIGIYRTKFNIAVDFYYFIICAASCLYSLGALDSTFCRVVNDV